MPLVKANVKTELRSIFENKNSEETIHRSWKHSLTAGNNFPIVSRVLPLFFELRMVNIKNLLPTLIFANSLYIYHFCVLPFSVRDDFSRNQKVHKFSERYKCTLSIPAIPKLVFSSFSRNIYCTSSSVYQQTW